MPSSSDRYRVRVGDVSGQVVVGSGNVVGFGGAREAGEELPDLSCVGRIVVVFDVQGSGGLTSREQARMRADLRRICGCGASAIRQSLEELEVSDLGDGLRLLISPDVVPPVGILDELVPAVAGALRANALAAERIRLRMSVHFGFVDRTGGAWSGAPLVHAARLVDASVAKQLLREDAAANLALVVSNEVYTSVVAQGHTRIGPSGYRRIDVAEKELSTHAWVRLD